MIRETLMGSQRTESNGFRWRGVEVSRIEALSDAVFGFAITLLVVSLEVPRTFDQLAYAIRGFPVFAACFALLFLIWFNQYRWFRRYGLEDQISIWLNAIMLFVIVFFVYPLRFVFGLVVGELMGQGTDALLPDGRRVPAISSEHQAAEMMLVFGAGYVAIFLLFALMHAHAWRQREALELNELERFDTRDNIRETLMSVGVGVLSMVMAARSGARFAGFVYLGVGPLMTAHGFLSGRARARVERRLAAEREASATQPISLPAPG
jgi:hypothetical protein